MLEPNQPGEGVYWLNNKDDDAAAGCRAAGERGILANHFATAVVRRGRKVAGLAGSKIAELPPWVRERFNL